MAQLEISLTQSGFISDWLLFSDKRMVSGLRKIGYILERQIKKNLSGESHTKNPDTSNPFPGVLNGTLRRAITSAVDSAELSVQTGPGGKVPYAAIHEFGGKAGRHHTTMIPARPYIAPAWEAKKTEAVDAFRRALLG